MPPRIEQGIAAPKTLQCQPCPALTGGAFFICHASRQARFFHLFFRSAQILQLTFGDFPASNGVLLGFYKHSRPTFASV